VIQAYSCILEFRNKSFIEVTRCYRRKEVPDIALQQAMSDQNVGPVELNKLILLLRVIGTGQKW
jgi:hypothetical protein